MVDVPRIARRGVKKRLSGEIGRVSLQSQAAKTDFAPVVFKAPVDGEITEASLIPFGTVSQSDSDYLTCTLYNTTDSSAMMTGKTTKTTGGTAMAHGTEISYTLTDGDVTEDDIISFNIVNTGSSGKAFPGGLLILKFVPD